MSIIACLNRVFGRRNGVDIKGNGADEANDAKTPRTYKVPDGLKPRILQLMDESDVPGTHHRATEELWYLLSERCPETKEGKWRFISRGKDVFLFEVVKPELDQGHCA